MKMSLQNLQTIPVLVADEQHSGSAWSWAHQSHLAETHNIVCCLTLQTSNKSNYITVPASIPRWIVSAISFLISHSHLLLLLKVFYHNACKPTCGCFMTDWSQSDIGNISSSRLVSEKTKKCTFSMTLLWHQQRLKLHDICSCNICIL